MMCEACERGDHAMCGLQTWCSCECDPEMAAAFPFDDPNEAFADNDDYDDE